MIFRQRLRHMIKSSKSLLENKLQPERDSMYMISTFVYRKFPKYSDTQKICCDHSKMWTMWLYHRVMSPNDAEGVANSVDPDQTAPLGAVWSGSELFAQTCLSENLGSLRYCSELIILSFWQTGLSKQCKPRSDCVLFCLHPFDTLTVWYIVGFLQQLFCVSKCFGFLLSVVTLYL